MTWSDARISEDCCRRSALPFLRFGRWQRLFGLMGLIIILSVDPASSIENSTIIFRPIIDDKPEPIYPSLPSSPDHSFDEEHESYFIKPLGFRPNSIFVGRETEISEMHRMLFDKRKREEGTSAVLLQSIPGGGKTHLARQYVYEHKEDFPGGIFWIRAKSQAELASGFWDIARKAALTDSKGASEVLRNDPQQFIGLVKKWLNNRRDWLLVLDGIHFTDDIVSQCPMTLLSHPHSEMRREQAC